jgi:hypothetical protein
METAWPWLVIAGLGLYHGLNPAMGWLFAVALGLHRGSRTVVLQALAPIAFGHALAVAAAAAALVTLGLVVDQTVLRAAAGIALVGWGAYHGLAGTRHRVRIGMQTGLAGLAMWSFLMAGAHGAGLMLVPALFPLCLSDGTAAAMPTGSPLMALAAVGVHTAASLAVTGAIAITVYEWIGVDFLRRRWINFDRLWTIELSATGLALLMP